MEFEQFWKETVCAKLEKKTCAARFSRIPKKRHGELESAMQNYAAHCEAEKSWYHPMHASTFLGTRKGWENWIPDTKPEESDSVKPDVSPACRGQHFCEHCPEPHDWTCTEPFCARGESAPCRDWMEDFNRRRRAAAERWKEETA